VLWYCVGAIILGGVLFLAWGFYLNSHPESLARLEATKEPAVASRHGDTRGRESTIAPEQPSPPPQPGRFAVIDIETTGLSAAQHHRIVEVAVVVVDDDGHHVLEWETLVNPEREVTAIEVHGLTAQVLGAAPTFGEIAEELRAILTGRVPVAHNMQFDGPFLAAEFARAGYPVPLASDFGLCTKRMAARYLRHAPKKTLESCCAEAGVTFEANHRALGDARAAAALLKRYIADDAAFAARWSDAFSRAKPEPWPARGCVRRAAAKTRQSKTTKAHVATPWDGRLRAGDAVVFTGEAPYATREEMQEEAVRLGFRTTGSVSGRTRLVVAADVHSLSGKARGARERGIPIVTYAEYRQLTRESPGVD